MVGAVAFTYGLLMSFVMSAIARNTKLKRPNPRMVQAIGYVLCGMTAMLSITLFAGAAALEMGLVEL